MAEFLSPAWVVALDAALRDAPLRARAPDDSLAYELQARTAGGEVRTHHVTIGPDGARATAGHAPHADLVLVTDAETAFALHRNELNAQAAIASGQLRIRGDLEAFSRHAGAIASLDDLFSALRASTTATGTGLTRATPEPGDDDDR